MPKSLKASFRSLLLFSILLCSVLLCTACAELTSRHDLNTSTSHPEASDQGPFGDNSSRRLGEPSNIAKSSQRVALILGPGGYKAFAEVGVIKELLKAQIPIGAVMGVEWGALVGALYAQRGQIHEAEWKLYKLEQLDLNSTSFFSSRRKMKPISELSGFLSQNLENIDVGQTAIPFACPSLSIDRGTVELQASGVLPSAVQSCLPMPPLFSPAGDNVAAVLSLPDLVSRLRGEGYKIIVLVNVLGEGNLFNNSKSDLN